MIRVACSLALVLALALAIPVLARGESPAIVEYLEDSIPTFVAEGNGFKLSGELSKSELPAVPVPILAVSPCGLVMIKHGGQELWLNRIDLDIRPKQKVQNCQKTIGTRTDHRNHGTKGIGENN